MLAAPARTNPRPIPLRRAFAVPELIWCASLLMAAGATFVITAAPTTLEDFFHPGTQPVPAAGSIVEPIESVNRCDSCHGGYDPENEPFRPWAASMMGQSMRDPMFRACMTIAEQDAEFVGDLCLRCHTPKGWLEGRSTPTDGSALIAADFEGINCNFCHRMVDPVYQPGVSPAVDQAILAGLDHPPVSIHNGSYVVDPLDVRRGPFDLGNFNKHDWLHSPFHATSNHCATCHDVSNPAFTKQPDGTFALNQLGAAHETGDKHDMFPIERTYSEWANSAFAVAPIEMGGRFGGNLSAVSSCQDCHMPDATGKGCKTGDVRADLPTHQFNGGNNWVLEAVRNLYPDSETGLDGDSVAASIARTENMLRAASDLELSRDGRNLVARVINMSGHKLPSGYPEGRRIWVNVEFYDAADAEIVEHGAYDETTATLTTNGTTVYEAKIGVDAAVSAATGIPEGPGFHFAVNNVWFKDNRIPPMGFTNAAFESIGAAPVAHTYADGQHWDDTPYTIPFHARRANVKVYYQLASKEYIEFLRDANTTNNDGDILYAQWALTGMSPPVEMDAAELAVLPADLTTTNTNPGDANYGAPDGLVDGADLSYFIEAWLADAPTADTTTTNTNPGDPGYGLPDSAIDGADLSMYVEQWLSP